MQRIFYLQALVIGVIAVLHLYFGIHEMLYWHIWWWDILLHILGGLWVALAGAWILPQFGIRVSFAHCVLIAFGIGVGWEVFEYIIGLGGSPFMSYPLDTAKDLLDDVLGGALAGVIISRV